MSYERNVKQFKIDEENVDIESIKKNQNSANKVRVTPRVQTFDYHNTN